MSTRVVKQNMNNFFSFIRSIKRIVWLCPVYFEYSIHKLFYINSNFVFKNLNYRYFYHPYNFTWRNERCVEVPIAYSYVKKYSKKKILEIGNVLQNYYDFSHTVVDKYEVGKGVINKDLMEISESTKYGLIISISTFEHIGWDETPRVPNKVLDAFNKVQKILEKDGVAIITFPLGYNSYLDKLVFENKLPCQSIGYLKKVSRDDWIEVSKDNVLGVKYNLPFRYANGLVVCVLKS